MKMTAWEIRMFPVLNQLAKEAFEASELIQKHYSNSFVANQQLINVYHGVGNQNYVVDCFLTINNTFDIYDNWLGGRMYRLSCDAESIYKMLRYCYLRDNNLQHLNPDVFDCPIEHIDTYFRRFISTLK